MVTYQNAVNGQGGADIYTAVDPDGLGPAGFGKPIVVAHSHVGGFDFIPAQPNRSIDAEANLAWDRSGGAHNGRVYLVWTQETPNESDNTDIMLQHSDNNGASWSPAIKLNDDQTTNSQYDPAIALDQSTGDVAVSWYDTRNDLGTGGSGDTDGIRNDDFQIWATDSTNGGATFAPNFQVSKGTSNAVDVKQLLRHRRLHARRVCVRRLLAGLVGQLEQHRRQPGRDSAPVRPLHGEGVHPVARTALGYRPHPVAALHVCEHLASRAAESRRRPSSCTSRLVTTGSRRVSARGRAQARRCGYALPTSRRCSRGACAPFLGRSISPLRSLHSTCRPRRAREPATRATKATSNRWREWTPRREAVSGGHC